MRSSIVVIVDGLGAQNITEAKAHARFLSASLSKASTISTVFPSTTAVALPSFTTGVAPGIHGMTGYRIRDPESGNFYNALTGLDTLQKPESWLGAPPLYGIARDDGILPIIISKPRFAATPLTRLIHSGAESRGAVTITDRCDAALHAVKQGRTLVVLYISELDEIAHAHGVHSHSWASKLEDVDSELARLSAGLPKDVSLLVTSDHGVIDISPNAHVLYGEEPAMMVGIAGVGGEPRCLQLFLDPGVVATQVIERWSTQLGESAFVIGRAEMAASGWLGEVTEHNTARLGDVFVLARKEVVFFDARDPTNKARRMVGHHGGISPAEMRIPLLVLN